MITPNKTCYLIFCHFEKSGKRYRKKSFDQAKKAIPGMVVITKTPTEWRPKTPALKGICGPKIKKLPKNSNFGKSRNL